MIAYIPAPAAEPMGIVISRGSRAEAAPRFRAFEWAPAPEEVVATTEQPKAA